MRSIPYSIKKQIVSTYEKETRRKIGNPFNAIVIGVERSSFAFI